MHPLPQVCHDEALLKTGPVPDAYPVPREELEDLLEQSRLLAGLVEFLGCRAVQTSLGTRHESEYPKPDPWVMGYSIETEHDGCYEFRRLAEGSDRWEVLRAGLAAWEKQRAEWSAQDDGRDW